MKLCAENLSKLDERVARPRYDRATVTAGIVHFGVGGFHRSHQAMYIDRLMNRGECLDWGICGVGLMPADKVMRNVLASQDFLYTLGVRPAKGPLEPRVIGSLVDHIYAPDDPEQVLEAMVDPATRIVSLTVTEGGYNIDPVSGSFDADNPRCPGRPRPWPASEHNVWLRRGGAAPAQSARAKAFLRNVLRQHPVKWSGGALEYHGLCCAFRPRAGRVDRR